MDNTIIDIDLDTIVIADTNSNNNTMTNKGGKKSRERARNKARYEIKNRIIHDASSLSPNDDDKVNGNDKNQQQYNKSYNCWDDLARDIVSSSVSVGTSSSSSPSSPLPFSSLSSSSPSSSSSSSILSFLRYPRAIEQGSSSVFSLRTVNNNYKLFQSSFTICYCRRPIICSNTISSSSLKCEQTIATMDIIFNKDRIETLCTSRFGKYYSKNVSDYLFGMDRNRVIVDNEGNEILRRVRKNHSVTILEIASLIGEYGIMSALLSAGIHTIFSHHDENNYDCDKYEDNDDEYDKDNIKTDIQEQRKELLLLRQKRKNSIERQVMKRFFIDSIDRIVPLSLVVYIVTIVFKMKMKAFVRDKVIEDEEVKEDEQNRQHNNEEFIINDNILPLEIVKESRIFHKNDDSPTTIVQRCQMCDMHNNNKNIDNNEETQQQQQLLLRFDKCDHTCCEICLWEGLLRNLDENSNNDEFNADVDVARCVICGMGGHVDENKGKKGGGGSYCHNNEYDDDDDDKINIDGAVYDGTDDDDRLVSVFHDDARMRKCKRSLELYQTLPRTIDDLKKLPSRKKKNRKNQNKNHKGVGDNTVTMVQQQHQENLHKTWRDTILPKIGSSRDVRNDRFERYVRSGSIPHVSVILEEGVDVNGTVNEYGQTMMYIACWKKHYSTVKLLLKWGGDVNIMANGGMNCLDVLRENMNYRGGNNDGEVSSNEDKRRIEIMKMILPFIAPKDPLPCALRERILDLHRNQCHKHQSLVLPNDDNSKDQLACFQPWLDNNPPLQKILIPIESNHPGAGACIFDNVLPEFLLIGLDALYRSLPIALENKSSMKKKKMMMKKKVKKEKEMTKKKMKEKGKVEEYLDRKGQEEKEKIEEKEEEEKEEINNNPCCSIRSYFCDAEGFLSDILSRSVYAAQRSRNESKNFAITNDSVGTPFISSPLLPQHQRGPQQQQQSMSMMNIQFMPNMRFLNYDRRGLSLPGHVDLARVIDDDVDYSKVKDLDGDDSASRMRRRSTHTFLLYLTDCITGGETSLLKALSPPIVSGQNVKKEEVLAKILPTRGRLLLFPHGCPHAGEEVIDVPKILMRGEALYE